MLTPAERLVTIAAVAVAVGAGLAAANPPPAAVGGRQTAVTAPAPAPTAITAAPEQPPVPTAPPPRSPEPVPPTLQAAAGPLPAPPEPPRAGCPPPPRPPGPPHPATPAPAPAVPDDRLPAPLAPRPKAGSLAAVSGRGIWVTNWPTTRVDVDDVVRRAGQAGLQSVWVRTGGSRQGYYGDTVLPRLVPAAHAAGLRVVAWDFPFLSDPVADALRMRQALDAGVDAVAPDIETSAEGTFATPQRITLYLSLVRAAAGQRPVAATVPRPTPWRVQNYPYAVFAPYADVFVPMVYWSCYEPGALAEQSVQVLRTWLPVHVLGQAYDMGSEGGRAGLPTFAETWRFLDAARRAGAVGASLWTIEQTGPEQWRALTSYPWAQVPP